MSGQATVYSFNCYQKGINYLPEGSPPITSVFTTQWADTAVWIQSQLARPSEWTHVRIVPLPKHPVPNLPTQIPFINVGL